MRLLIRTGSILDFPKIEDHKLNLKVLDFYPRTMIESTKEMLLAIRAAKTGLELICPVNLEVPSWLHFKVEEKNIL